MGEAVSVATLLRREKPPEPSSHGGREATAATGALPALAVLGTAVLDEAVRQPSAYADAGTAPGSGAAGAGRAGRAAASGGRSVVTRNGGSPLAGDLPVAAGSTIGPARWAYRRPVARRPRPQRPSPPPPGRCRDASRRQLTGRRHAEHRLTCAGSPAAGSASSSGSGSGGVFEPAPGSVEVTPPRRSYSATSDGASTYEE